MTGEPRRLGNRYEIGEVLGRGGMAEVHMARDIRLGRVVAVKTLRSDLARDPSFQARFRREAQSAASLNHPSVVAVYDTGEDSVSGASLPYIVMEYVEGSTLRDLLRSGRRLLPERALEITAGVLQALDYSHRNGIVHRDIKPGNVMLNRAGEVKVMDFGIARAMAADVGATMTATSAVIGTAQYLSPEQARGEPVDARSDLYSTGCMLYELLTGRPPFVGDSPVAVAVQHVREEPVPPSRLDPDIPPVVDAIVLKSLAKDRDYRYQSAMEMRADIERALAGRPVAGPAASSAQTQRMAPMPQTQAMPPQRRRHEEPESRAGAYVLLGVAALVVFILAALLGRALFGEASTKQVKMTSLVNLQLEEAKSRLTADGFVLGDVTEKSDDRDKGTVLSQTPEAGTLTDEGATVRLVVSLGPELTAAPNLEGMSLDRAKQEIRDAGLEVGQVDEESSDSVPKGQVIRSDPGAGKKLAPGEKVDLVVSSGEANQSVPSVIGMLEDQAVSTLRDAGFTPVREGIDETSGLPDGTVTSQTPQEGAEEAKGTVVTYMVAKSPQGPPPATDPQPGDPTTVLPPGGGGDG